MLKSEHEKPAWKQVISAVPQIQCFKLDAQWEFVVVGSDGVWDAMSNQVTIWPLLKAETARAFLNEKMSLDLSMLSFRAAL